jgi:hypothetical protein
MSRKSETLGTNTSKVEVRRIFTNRIWLLVYENEYFLSFDKFPWFKNAPMPAIQKVELSSEHHLYWPELDIDLAVESIEHPERFPLVAK